MIERKGIKQRYWETRESMRRSPYVHRRNPVLRRSAETVPLDQITSPEIQQRIDHLLTVAAGEKQRALAGLADPQITKKGNALRIIVVDLAVTGKAAIQPEPNYLVLINPEVVHANTDKKPNVLTAQEGCFSADNQIVGLFPRPDHIKIKAWGKNGQIIERDFDGYQARIVSHEIDHLNGIVFVDHITDPSKQLIRRKLAERELIYKIGFANWPRRGTERHLKRLQKGKRHNPFGLGFRRTITSK